MLIKFPISRYFILQKYFHKIIKIQRKNNIKFMLYNEKKLTYFFRFLMLNL